MALQFNVLQMLQFICSCNLDVYCILLQAYTQDLITTYLFLFL